MMNVRIGLDDVFKKCYTEEIYLYQDIVSLSFS